MTEILDFIKSEKINTQDIKYVTRSALGTWSISLIDQGNTTNRSITSYNKITDSDIQELKSLNVKVKDWLGFFESDLEYSEFEKQVENNLNA